MSDPNVHVGTHPSGHPNKTAVNAENPIFGRPADPIPEVSMQQAAVVQSEKNPRETVQSPLINESIASPVLPSAEDLDAVAAETAVKEATSETVSESFRERQPDEVDPVAKADDWTQTTGAGLTDDTSSATSGAEYTHSSGEGSSKITGVGPVVLPTQEEADAIVAAAKAEDEQRKIEADGPETPNAAVDSQFATGQKVRFAPESGNDTESVYTIDGGELHNEEWFWRIVELPGLFLGQNLMPAGLAEA